MGLVGAQCASLGTDTSSHGWTQLCLDGSTCLDLVTEGSDRGDEKSNSKEEKNRENTTHRREEREGKQNRQERGGKKNARRERVLF